MSSEKPTLQTELKQKEIRSGLLGVPLPLVLSWSIVTVALIIFSQTGVGYGDEGFHLLASQLILSGKLPYVDFFFLHPPLYIFLNAAWMRMFGDTWQAAHLFSALLTSGCVVLTGRFVYDNLPQAPWRLPGAMAASLITGFHQLTLWIGVIGQAYALCLLLSVASVYILTTQTSKKKKLLFFWTGVCAGGAVAAWFLSLPLWIVLFIWIIKYSDPADRFAHTMSFICGSAIPFLPLAWLAIQAPSQVFFELFVYHFFHRIGLSWEGIGHIRWHLSVLTGWLESPQSILLAFLAALGVAWIRKEMPHEQRPVFYLCAWLTVSFALLSSAVHPTFAQYFILMVPFLSILASIGLGAVVPIVRPFVKPLWAVVGFALIFGFTTHKLIFWELLLRSSQWRTIDSIAQHVNEISAPDAYVYADELLYFAARRVPPHGLENSLSAELHLPEDRFHSLQIVSGNEIDRQLAAGKFDVIMVWNDDPRIERYNWTKLYDRRANYGNYSIFSRSVSSKPQKSL